MQHHEAQSPEVAAWLDAVALHESPWLYTRWAALCAASAQAGIKISLEHMYKPMRANMYVLFAAPPASRKSTVLNFTMTMLKEAGHINFCPTDLTKVGLLRALKSGEFRRNQDSQRAKRGQTAGRLAAAWEISESIGGDFGKSGSNRGKIGNRSKVDSAQYSEDDLLDTLDEDDLDSAASIGSPMSIFSHELQVMFPKQASEVFALLQELYDCVDEYTGRDAIIENPYVTMLALLNAEALPHIFQHRTLLTGLMSRLVFVQAPKSNRTFNGFTAKGRMPGLDPMASVLKQIGNMKGDMEFDKDAEALYQKICELPKSLYTPDSRFEPYSERRNEHLMKMCMNQALLCRRLNISLEDVKYCHTLLAYTELYMTDALGEYGFNRDSNAQSSILKVLGQSAEGCTSAKLLASCQHYVNNNEDLVPILQYMEGAGLIKKVNPISTKSTGDITPLYFKVGANLKKWVPHYEITVFPQYLEEWSLLIN